MEQKAVSGLMLTLLVIGLLAFAFNVQFVKAQGIIYIHADGSVEPSTAPIIRHANVYTFTNNMYDEIVIERSGVTVDGAGYTLHGSGSGYGFYWSDIDRVTITNTNIQNYDYGINFEASSSNTITVNTIKNCTWFGICTYDSPKNTISQNNINYSQNGIYLEASSSNTISGNTIENSSMDGIDISDSSNTDISGNTITNCDYYGISISWSSNNVLRNNAMINNKYGFNVGGDALTYFINDADTSNTINGKPIHYLINQNNLVIDPSTYPNIGYLALINSIKITVKELELIDNGQGILFAYTNNSQITNNNIVDNEIGVDLESSSNNTISGNQITNNYGVFLGSSSLNTLSGNTITNCEDGIYLYLSSNNNVSGNNILHGGSNGVYLYSSSLNTISVNNITSNKWYGTYIYSSYNNIVSRNNITNNYSGIYLYASSNKFYNNNFINNTIQVLSRELPNTFDNGYPSGGNYWSDYTEIDLNWGPYQNITGSDGISDTPYVIDANNRDKYPLTSPYEYWSNPILGDINKDMTVDCEDLLQSAISYGLTSQSPKWNPNVDLNHDSKIDSSDLLTLTQNYGKTIHKPSYSFYKLQR